MEKRAPCGLCGLHSRANKAKVLRDSLPGKHAHKSPDHADDNLPRRIVLQDHGEPSLPGLPQDHFWMGHFYAVVMQYRMQLYRLAPFRTRQSRLLG